MIEDKKYLAYHPTVAEVATVRAEVQRLFVKSKKDNAREYGNYIAAVDKGERLGFAPAPILWSRDLLQVIPLGLSNLCVVVIPRGKMTIPIDGETQVAGRFQAWERDESLKEVTFPVLLAHSRTEDWARQTFHDVNVFGIKPNAALAISMDQYDPATQIARTLTTKGAVPSGQGQHDRSPARKGGARGRPDHHDRGFANQCRHAEQRNRRRRGRR